MIPKLPLPIIRAEASAAQIDPALIAAICIVESAGDTWAVRYEPLWSTLLNPMKWARAVSVSTATEEMCQRMSWGLMQVMGTVARELGLEEDIPTLCRPDIGVHYGVKKFRQCLDRANALPLHRQTHPGTYWAIAAYNAGTPRVLPNGKFKNQQYLDDVLGMWQNLKDQKLFV